MTIVAPVGRFIMNEIAMPPTTEMTPKMAAINMAGLNLFAICRDVTAGRINSSEKGTDLFWSNNYTIILALKKLVVAYVVGFQCNESFLLAAAQSRRYRLIRV